jgi:hypothetical protein
VRDSKIYLNQTGFLLQGYVDACDENGNSVFTNGEKPPIFGDAW